MEELFGVVVYKVADVTDALPKMKHVSWHGPKGRYSYGGVRDLVRRRFPDKQPYKQGAYMHVKNLAKADAIIEGRPRIRERFVGKDVETEDFFGEQVVKLEAYASYRGYSLSNIRKVFYEDGNGFAELFTIIHGGFLFSEAEYKDIVAWIQEFGAGPRPKRKRTIGHRANLLDTRKTNAARRVGTTPVEKEQDL